MTAAEGRYRLAHDGYVYAETNEEGNVLRKHRYRKGDDLKDVPQEDLDRLLSLGAAVDTEAQEDGQDTQEDSEGQAALTGGQSAAQENAPQGGGEDDEEDESDDDESDEYDEMDYPTLQQTAKERGLNAGGSATDLRERLREADADES